MKTPSLAMPTGGRKQTNLSSVREGSTRQVCSEYCRPWNPGQCWATSSQILYCIHNENDVRHTAIAYHGPSCKMQGAGRRVQGARCAWAREWIFVATASCMRTLVSSRQTFSKFATTNLVAWRSCLGQPCAQILPRRWGFQNCELAFQYRDWSTVLIIVVLCQVWSINLQLGRRVIPPGSVHSLGVPRAIRVHHESSWTAETCWRYHLSPRTVKSFASSFWVS